MNSHTTLIDIHEKQILVRLKTRAFIIDFLEFHPQDMSFTFSSKGEYFSQKINGASISFDYANKQTLQEVLSNRFELDISDVDGSDMQTVNDLISTLESLFESYLHEAYGIDLDSLNSKKIRTQASSESNSIFRNRMKEENKKLVSFYIDESLKNEIHELIKDMPYRKEEAIGHLIRDLFEQEEQPGLFLAEQGYRVPM